MSLYKISDLEGLGLGFPLGFLYLGVQEVLIVDFNLDFPFSIAVAVATAAAVVDDDVVFYSIDRLQLDSTQKSIKPSAEKYPSPWSIESHVNIHWYHTETSTQDTKYSLSYLPKSGLASNTSTQPIHTIVIAIL
jgi:hypothetical protein